MLRSLLSDSLLEMLSPREPTGLGDPAPLVLWNGNDAVVLFV